MFKKIVFLAAVLAATSGQAKPLLLNSQDSFASACLRGNDTPGRLIAICNKALADHSASASQRADMKDVLIWAYFDDGQLELARRLAIELRDEAPQSHLGWASRAWLDFNVDNYQAAAENFAKAREIEISPGVLSGLAASRYYLEELSLDETLEQLDLALALNPEYTWALREQGWILGRAGQHDAAIEKFEQAQQVDPLSYQATYGALWVLTESNQWEKALDAANKTLDLRPGYQNALSRRSLTYLHLDRPKMAIKDAEAILAKTPNSSDGHVRKARALNALGQRRAAIDLLAEFDGQHPFDSYLLYWLASLLHDEGDLEPAKQHMDRIFDAGEQSYFDMYLRAYIHLDLGDFDATLQDVENALAERPASEWAMWIKARAMIGQGAPEVAMSTIEAAFEAGLPATEVQTFVADFLAQGNVLHAIAVRRRFGA